MRSRPRWLQRAVRAFLPAASTLAMTWNAAPSHAQEPDSANAPRYFGGHQFVPSKLVPDPFISTSFTSTTGFGKAINITVPLENLEGQQVGELTGNVGFMLLEFEYQYAFKKRWALRVGASGGARTGTTVPSLLAEGASAIYGYEFGGLARLIQQRNWLLTATADVRGNTLYGIAPMDFARAVKNSVLSGDTLGAVSGAEDVLLSSGDNIRVLGGLRGAYTPSHWIGFMGFFEGGGGSHFGETSNQVGVAIFGAVASVDLNTLRGHVPFGVTTSFRHETLSERGDDASGGTSSVGLGFLYNGRRFFSVGLENFWQSIQQPLTGEHFDAVQTRILLRYDFN